MAPSNLMRRSTAGVAAVLAVLLVLFVSAGASAGGDSIVTQTVKGSFENTVTGLKKAITANRLVIIKEISVTQMLGMVGVKAEKIMLVEIFHPRYGKVVYANDKNAFVELPFRFLVQDKGGQVMIRYRKPSAMLAGYSGLSNLGNDLDQVLANIIGSVAQ